MGAFQTQLWAGNFDSTARCMQGGASRRVSARLVSGEQLQDADAAVSADDVSRVEKNVCVGK